jgi:hypothetical protein
MPLGIAVLFGVGRKVFSNLWFQNDFSQFEICDLQSEILSDISFLDGVFDEVGSFFEAQLVHEVGAVALHSANADKEKITNLLTRFSFGDQL